MESNDPVNKPSHYTDGKIEVIDFIEDKKLNFNLGNSVKYIARAGKKNPDKHIEDLEKAAWYLNREISNLRGKHKEPSKDTFSVSEFELPELITTEKGDKASILNISFKYGPVVYFNLLEKHKKDFILSKLHLYVKDEDCSKWNKYDFYNLPPKCYRTTSTRL